MHVLPLPHPLILLPTGRITLPVQRSIGEALLTFVQEAEAQPVIAAVPVTANNTLNSWGTAARILRLIRPQARNPRQPYLLTLTGLSRVRIVDSAPDVSAETTSADALGGIIERRVEFPIQDGVPAMESVLKFKAAALRLLEQLARDSAQQAKRDGYNKVASMIEETSPLRAPWMADLMVANVNGEYADRLEYLSAVDVDDRLRRATALFVKQTSISEVSKRIAQSVDESLSKQQKEYFLRQQLAAIQRELQDLRRSPSIGGGLSTGDSGPGSPVSELDDESAEAEDMSEIKAKIEAMAKDSEERRMAVREWRRLKRIPQGSVEHGVIRNYVRRVPLARVPYSEAHLMSCGLAGMAHSDPMARIIHYDTLKHTGDSPRPCIP
ncbi:hypothetical protein NM688_g6574 [Phlebia brevispora]|uniref:Uncharacterized protein n=1 Tax=Phlebia brevispora TaxID=194682 RepID=A0ACC1SES4_9APHY|nr:hypothetical protein NM688_g6574 [Phlebia brevispora]